MGNKEEAKNHFNKAMKESAMFEKNVLKRTVHHKLRQSIIALFESNEDISYMTVMDVSEKLDIETSVASKHIDTLRRAGIINAEKQGGGVHYTLDKDRLKQVLNIVENPLVQGNKNTPHIQN